MTIYTSTCLSGSIAVQEQLASKGRKLVCITDPHMKRDGRWKVFQEASAGHHLVKGADGKEFEGWCWPGQSSWVDFHDPAAREWYAKQFAYDRWEVCPPCRARWRNRRGRDSPGEGVEWPYAVGGGGYPPWTPPPPLQTKVTIAGKNEIYKRESLVAIFGTQTFGSQTLPPLFFSNTSLTAPRRQRGLGAGAGSHTAWGGGGRWIGAPGQNRVPTRGSAEVLTRTPTSHFRPPLEAGAHGTGSQARWQRRLLAIGKAVEIARPKWAERRASAAWGLERSSAGDNRSTGSHGGGCSGVESVRLPFPEKWWRRATLRCGTLGT